MPDNTAAAILEMIVRHADLDSVLKAVDQGDGSLGQLVRNRSLYDHADQTLDQTQQLVKGIREDPKKYLVIHMKLF